MSLFFLLDASLNAVAFTVSKPMIQTSTIFKSIHILWYSSTLTNFFGHSKRHGVLIGQLLKFSQFSFEAVNTVFRYCSNLWEVTPRGVVVPQD